MSLIHYYGSKGPQVIEQMHSAHLRMAAAKIRREGHNHPTATAEELATHMEAVAHRKEREWHDGQPAAYAEWAAKYPEKHADFQAHHFGKGI